MFVCVCVLCVWGGYKSSLLAVYNPYSEGFSHTNPRWSSIRKEEATIQPIHHFIHGCVFTYTVLSYQSSIDNPYSSYLSIVAAWLLQIHAIQSRIHGCHTYYVRLLYTADIISLKFRVHILYFLELFSHCQQNCRLRRCTRFTRFLPKFEPITQYMWNVFCYFQRSSKCSTKEIPFIIPIVVVTFT